MPRFGKGNNGEDQFLGYVGACIDITDLHNAKANADKVAVAKSNFLANMRYVNKQNICEISSLTRDLVA